MTTEATTIEQQLHQTKLQFNGLLHENKALGKKVYESTAEVIRTEAQRSLQEEQFTAALNERDGLLKNAGGIISNLEAQVKTLTDKVAEAHAAGFLKLDDEPTDPDNTPPSPPENPDAEPIDPETPDEAPPPEPEEYKSTKKRKAAQH